MISAALARHLDAQITGLSYAAPGSTGGNVYADWMPDEPDRAVAVMTGQPLPQLTRQATDLPQMQVLVRDRKSRDGEALARAVYSALTCMRRATLAAGTDDEVLVLGCTAAQSGPVSIGRDAVDRHEWSINFSLRVHAPTTHRPGGS